MSFKLRQNRVYNLSSNLHPPENITLGTRTQTSIELVFTPPYIHGDAQNYKVYETLQGLGEVASATFSGTTNIVVTGLSVFTAYSFYIVTEKSGTLSPQSSSIGASTTGSDTWNLNTGNFVSGLTTTLQPLTVVYPRPSGETNSDAYCKNCYPGMYWEIPIGVRGGAWPYKFELTDSLGNPGTAGVDYPTGMSIGETLTIIAENEQVEGPDYGILSWPVPVAGSETVYVKVTDQDSSSVLITIPLTIATTNWIFVDGVGGLDTNSGTLASPLQTFNNGLYEGSDTASSYLGKIAVFRAGTYTINNGTTDVNATLDDTYKPRTYIPYHDGASFESVIFNCDTGHIDGNSDDLFLAHIGIQGNRETQPNPKTIQLFNSRDRRVLYNLNFTNQFGGTSGSDNPACIMSNYSANDRDQYTLISHCTTDGTVDLPLHTLFSQSYALLQYNESNGQTLNATSGGNSQFVMFLKADYDHCTMRRNKIVNFTSDVTGKRLMGFGSQNVDNPGRCQDNEMCWNLISSDVGNAIDYQMVFAGNTGTYGGLQDSFVYRNTVTTTAVNGSGMSFLTVNIGNAVQVIDNVIAVPDTAIAGNTPTDYVSTGDVSIAPADISATGDLLNASRTSYLGTKGWEVK